jgi:virginiamycin B lyase
VAGTVSHGAPRRAAAWLGALALIVLLLAPSPAAGNFVYWTSQGPGTVGRAKINGTGLNNSLITGLNAPTGVAVDSKFIYWAEQDGNRIGRANLDGTGVNRDFIPGAAGVSQATGIAVTPTSVLWANDGTNTIGRANLDGTGVDPAFIATTAPGNCGLAADANFVYWTDTTALDRIGRAPVGGGTAEPTFISGISARCGVTVDPSFVYWGSQTPDTSIGRASIGGTGADENFIPAAVSSFFVCGVAVNSQYVFWGNPGANAVGRANIKGTSPNATFAPGAGEPCLLAAAPSNKVTINSITKKKRKGTATINAKVPGPGQVTLSETGTQDVNATASAVKPQSLTIPAASSFKLAVKPKGKTAKKLKKQLKRKGKAKASVKVFVTFVPSGVAGVPNSKPQKLTLVKTRKKGKK